MDNLSHRQFEDFQHGAQRERHGGPREPGPLRLLWPTVALPLCSVLNPFLETTQRPDAPRSVTGSPLGETPCNSLPPGHDPGVEIITTLKPCTHPPGSPAGETPCTVEITATLKPDTRPLGSPAGGTPCTVELPATLKPDTHPLGSRAGGTPCNSLPPGHDPGVEITATVRPVDEPRERNRPNGSRNGPNSATPRKPSQQSIHNPAMRALRRNRPSAPTTRTTARPSHPPGHYLTRRALRLNRSPATAPRVCPHVRCVVCDRRRDCSRTTRRGRAPATLCPSSHAARKPPRQQRLPAHNRCVGLRWCNS